jgi:Helix-turn-helix of DDE superfamily endonuclease
MKYEKLQVLPAHLFCRSTGVKKGTFAVMIEIITASDRVRLKGVGRPSKLSHEDQILMTLEYLREYRTYYHIGIDYGISESSAFKIIRRTEDALVKSKRFALPSRKEGLNNSLITKETIDCTESPVERPQKNSANTTRERKNGIQSRRNS